MNKKLLAVAISGAIAAPMAASAIEFSTSGHVNRMVRWAGDGIGSDVQHIDNSASRSRIRFKGAQDIGNGLNAGVYIEFSMVSNLGSSVPLKTADGTKGNQDLTADVRHSAIWFSGNWGKLTVGHTSDASDGIRFADQDGAWAANEVSTPNETAGAILFRTTAGGTAGSLTGAFNSYDGGRRDVLRYDSPALGPATIKVSVSNNQEWDIGGFISTDLGGGSLLLNAGYRDAENRSGFDQYGGSVGFAFSQGTNLHLGWGERDRTGGGVTTDTIYAKLGHAWGNNAASVSYGESEHCGATTPGCEAQQWGIGFNHNIPKVGVQFYASYHNYELDLAGTEDIDVFFVGSRVQFK